MRRQITAALDVGTTKVSVLVAEADPLGSTENAGSLESLKLLGYADVPCEGLERGMVVGLEATIHAIEHALRTAEEMAEAPVRSVVAGISGEHVRSFNSTGVIGVARKDHEITREDVRRVIEAARAVAIPGDRSLLHVLPRDFTVDDHAGIFDPVGMTGVRLESEVHIVTVHATAARNLLRAIERAGIQAQTLVLHSLAAAESVLEEDERGLGVLLIEMGGGTTDIAVFQDGSVRHTAVVGYGGQAVSHDLAVGLRTPLERAEQIKLEHGTAIAGHAVSNESIEVPGVGGRDAREVSTQVVASIIEPRVEEIFGLVRTEVERVIDPALLAGGVVLTGGAARMPQIQELAERVLGLPTRIGCPQRLRGLGDLAFDPRLATSVGLLRFAEAPARTPKAAAELLDRMARPVREWLKAYF